MFFSSMSQLTSNYILHLLFPTTQIGEICFPSSSVSTARAKTLPAPPSSPPSGSLPSRPPLRRSSPTGFPCRQSASSVLSPSPRLIPTPRPPHPPPKRRQGLLPLLPLPTPRLCRRRFPARDSRSIGERVNRGCSSSCCNSSSCSFREECSRHSVKCLQVRREKVKSEKN